MIETVFVDPAESTVVLMTACQMSVEFDPHFQSTKDHIGVTGAPQ